MLKRILTLSLSVMILTSLCPTTSVFAADTKPAAIVEDFDGKTVDTINSRLVDINSAANKSIAIGEGRNGGDALKITGSPGSEAIGFKDSYAYGSNVLYLAYDFKLAKIPETNESTARAMGLAGSNKDGLSTITLRKTSGPTFSFHDPEVATDLATVIPGKWYRIITAKYYNQTDSWILDEDGNVVAFSNRSDHSGLKTQNEFALFRSTKKGLMDEGEILIDNVEYNVYAYTFGPSMMSDTLTKKTDVPLNTKSVTVTFDQPLDVLSATLTPEGGSAVACTMQAKKDANNADIPLTYVVTFPALASNTKYTLDFQGSYAKQGTSSREIHVDDTGRISFTTLDNSKTHLWDKIYDISVAPNDYETDITFKLADKPEYANTVFQGKIMAVLYQDGLMKGFVITEESSFAVNDGNDTNGVETNTVSFSLDTLPTNGYEIQLIQMDTASGLTPLAFGKYPEE